MNEMHEALRPMPGISVAEAEAMAARLGQRFAEHERAERTRALERRAIGPGPHHPARPRAALSVVQGLARALPGGDPRVSETTPSRGHPPASFARGQGRKDPSFPG